MADRRRVRASQDSESDEDEQEQQHQQAQEPPHPQEHPRRSVRARPVTKDKGRLHSVDESEVLSECESEEAYERDEVVLSEYESAEEVASNVGEEEISDREDDFEVKEVVKIKKSASKEAKSSEQVDGDVEDSLDGQEDEEAENKDVNKNPDADEDKQNPAYVPRKGLFFEHDIRGGTKEDDARAKARGRKLWKDEGRWEHDLYCEDEQLPKSSAELVSVYGYDIRFGNMAARGRIRAQRKPRYPQQSDREWTEESRPAYSQKKEHLQRSSKTWQNEQDEDVAISRETSYRSKGLQDEKQRIRKPKEYRGGNYKVDESMDNWHPAENEDRPQRSIPQHHTALLLDVNCAGHADVLNKDLATLRSAEAPLAPKVTEKKSYSRVRRSRIKGLEADRQALIEVAPPVAATLTEHDSQELAHPRPQAVQTVAPLKQHVPLPVKDWDLRNQGDHELANIGQGIAQMGLGSSSWNQRHHIAHMRHEATGINDVPPNTSNAQYRVDDMVGQGMRVKRYSSQRNRQLPDGGGPPPGAPPLPSAGAGQHPGAPPPPGVPPSGAPPPMHMGLMEDAYYNPSSPYQGPIYGHGEQPNVSPQGVMVPPNMSLPHPVLHPHPPAGHLYPSPVSVSPGQSPGPLLNPGYFSGGMLPGYPGTPLPSSSFPYSPSPLPHLFPTQAHPHVYGGVTYYNMMEQQVQPKPSPPRRATQPVSVKPPPEVNRKERAKEQGNT
uniref:Protein CASC3 n=1 Tax=Eptatretus burgeri TaxID=7764 RepID=A0A8C4WX15_EPTBU